MQPRTKPATSFARAARARIITALALATLALAAYGQTAHAAVANVDQGSIHTLATAEPTEAATAEPTEVITVTPEPTEAATPEPTEVISTTPEREVEFAGKVLAFSSSSITIGARSAAIGPNTEINGQIVVGAVAKVHAQLAADGTLVAREVSLVTAAPADGGNDGTADDHGGDKGSEHHDGTADDHGGDKGKDSGGEHHDGTTDDHGGDKGGEHSGGGDHGGDKGGEHSGGGDHSGGGKHDGHK